MSAAPQTASPQEHNKHLIVRWFEEVWNQNRSETISELLTADSVIHDGQNDIRGIEGFLRFSDAIRSEYSDIRITPLVSLSEGDLVCLHWAADLRHIATSRSVHITGTSVARIKDGHFLEAWQNWDQAAQLADS
jgi:predicted SnoaL-like aldol condensation-catalyzing enzyme